MGRLSRRCLSTRMLRKTERAPPGNSTAFDWRVWRDEPPAHQNIGRLHLGLTTEVLRESLIADGEAMGEAEAGAERTFHVAHESVGGMFPGELEPV
jgi:hypothetical protein